MTLQLTGAPNVSGLGTPTSGNLQNMTAPLQPWTGAVSRTLTSKLGDVVNALDFGVDPTGVSNSGTVIQAAITAAAGKTLRFTPGTYLLGSSTITISNPTNIECDGQGTVIFQKTAAVVGFTISSTNVQFTRCQVLGNIGGDTSSGIQIGHNDGANGQGAGYINASQCVFRDVLITACGNRGIDWQEGPFCEFDNVHCFNATQNNFYVSPNAFDASHGFWYTNSAGATGFGYSINWGTHHFAHAKSYSDTGGGLYLNNTRGCSGAIHAELSGGAFLQFGSSTLANHLHVHFWTSGKNYIDAGIGNKISGMSLGNNSGGYFDTYTRTNQLLIGNQFVANGGSVLSGGLGISQTANNLFTLGDPGNAYTCNLVASTAGVGLQGVGCHYKVFDLSSFGTPQDLNAGNQHINVFLLTNGQQLRINGAGGSAYTPFDGQVAIIYLKGAGSCTVYGYIAGSLQTITLSTTNGYLKYMWQAAQGYWFAAP